MHFKPAGYTSVAPYLIVSDARATIHFLRVAFDASLIQSIEAPDGRIRHAEVRIDDTVVMVADSAPGWPPVAAHVHIYLPDVDASLRSARLAVESKSGGHTPVELGRTAFRGELQVAGGEIQRLRGSVPQFDASIRDLDLETGEGALKVARGRIKGDTQLDFSGGHIIATGGNLDVDAVVTQASADLLRVGLPFDRTVMANGDVRVQTSLQGFTKREYAQEASATGQKTRVELEGGQLKSKAKVADLYGRFLR